MIHRDLPPKQTRVLEFIQKTLRSGPSPTLAEIGAQFGFTKRAAAKMVEKLEERGLIEREAGARRGIRIPGVNPGLSLPLIGRVAAGAPLLSAESIVAYKQIDPGLFRPRADFLFKVKGESMRDAGILDGDLVGVREQAEAHNGQIVVARLCSSATGEDEVTLKRYQRDGHRIRLLAENPAFAPIEIDLARHHADSQERPPIAIAGIYCGLVRAGGGS